MKINLPFVPEYVSCITQCKMCVEKNMSYQESIQCIHCKKAAWKLKNGNSTTSTTTLS